MMILQNTCFLLMHSFFLRGRRVHGLAGWVATFRGETFGHYGDMLIVSAIFSEALLS